MKMEPTYDAVDVVSHWVTITVHKTLGGERIAFLYWRDLPWAVRCKWSWYFKYRTALLQTQHPRCEVEMRWGNTPRANSEELELLNKVRAKKAKLTECNNKIAKARAGWTQLFPIETDDLYQRAIAKVAQLQAELTNLLKQAA